MKLNLCALMLRRFEKREGEEGRRAFLDGRAATRT